jgi:hypothetical protein
MPVRVRSERQSLSNCANAAEPERIFIALSNAEGALDMLASTVERFELMFVPFAKLAAERIRGDDDDNNEAFRNWDKPIR